MRGDTGQKLLKRMAGMAVAEDDRAVPETPARTLRLAMARAAQSALRLKLTVTSVGDDNAALDDVVTRFDEDLLHVTLNDDGQPAGYAVFDHEFRAALVEVQMTGRLAARPAGDRPVTGADAALCGVLFTALADDLCRPDRPGHFGPWVEQLSPGGRLMGPRAVSLALPDGHYRVLEFGVDLGVEGRAGRLWLVLPDRAAPKAKTPKPAATNWGRAFSVAVRSAPADLKAVLYRTRLTLREVTAFRPGMVLPLHGVTVDSVVVEGPGREIVGQGRLGQVTGMRAVRITSRGTAIRPLARAPGAGGASYGAGGLQLPASTDLRHPSEDPAAPAAALETAQATVPDMAGAGASDPVGPGDPGDAPPEDRFSEPAATADDADGGGGGSQPLELDDMPDPDVVDGMR